MAINNREQQKEKPASPRSSEILRTVEEYAADLRAVIEKLRRTLN
jgi:hypothetical protein